MTIDALAAGIITLGSLCTAIVAVGKLINLASKPNKDQNVRLTKLEDRMAKCESKLLNDNQSMIEQQEINSLTLKSLHALLSHALDGNNNSEMGAAKKRSKKEYLKMEGQSDDWLSFIYKEGVEHDSI